jgi:hypothetical protein
MTATLPVENDKGVDAIVDPPAPAAAATATTTTERIYIGGLHPQRLTLDEVLTRFPAEIVVERPSKNVDPRYAHLTVTATTATAATAAAATTPKTPLSTLQSLFHNVKWKGCKLIVQAAKPHFLTRLSAERQTWQGQGGDTAKDNPSNPSTETTPPGPTITTINSSGPRRFYRIRQQHGKPAWKVDTQPYQVQQAADFGKLVHHVRNKRSKLKAGRAVHLRFLTAEEEELATRQAGPLLRAPDDDSSASSSSSIPVAAGGYAWSSDDDSVRGVEKDATSRAAVDATKGVGGTTYAWSEDEDHSIHEARLRRNAERPPRTVQHDDLLLDEFAAGSEEEDNAAMSEVDESRQVGEAPETAVDLEADQAANLKILQQLFPDMAPPKAAKMNDKASNASYNPSGQMLRYDPTQASSWRLEQTVAETSSDDGNDENESDHMGDKAESVHEEETKPSEDPIPSQESEESEPDREEARVAVVPSMEQNDIYREKDLENVFRQARESQSRPAAVVTVAMESAAVAQADSGFSFGFDLPAEKKTTSPVQGFSFGFGLEDDSPSQGDSNIASAVANEKRAMDVDDNEAHERSAPRKRRCLQTSYPDLHRYVNAYLLETNEGEHIETDLKDFRQDVATQEHWNHQREKLTTDWKSKRKQALARQQKKSR